MYIQTQKTPNPNTIKFIPGVNVIKTGSYHFDKSSDDYSNSPLAIKLFQLDAVKSVFFGNDFISITKEKNIKWEIIKPYVLAELVDHFVAGIPVVENEKVFLEREVTQTDSVIERQIIELLNTKIRPAVAQDGGDIVYDRFVDGVVYLKLNGACQGCPSATITLKQGIENMLKHYIPEVESVKSI